MNWSEVVRDAIEDRVQLESKRIERDWDRVREASRLTDEIFHEMQRRYGHTDYDSVETIRAWREKRYGSTYWTRRSQ